MNGERKHLERVRQIYGQVPETMDTRAQCDPGMETFRVESEEYVLELIRALAQRSQWFQVTPLPDDEWRIRVKRGEHAWLAKLATQE